MEETSYRVGELAERTGVTKRTIHYYIGRGLLPPPEGAGLGAVYSEEHLYKILLIKKLQDRFLPLEEIRKRTAGMTLREVVLSLEGDGPLVSLPEPSNEYKTSDAGNKTAYERMNVGYGLEIHFPSDNQKARDMADVLYKYAQKIMKEG